AGTLTSTGASFTPCYPAFGSGAWTSALSGGRVIATNTTFAWDAFNLNNGSVLNPGDLANDTFQTFVSAPGTDVPLLAGSDLKAKNGRAAVEEIGASPARRRRRQQSKCAR